MWIALSASWWDIFGTIELLWEFYSNAFSHVSGTFAMKIGNKSHWAQFRGYDEIECLKGHWNGFKAQIGGFYD